MTLGSWERNLEETRVTGEVIRNVGVGIGTALGPFSLVGAAILAGLFFKNPIEEAKKEIEAFFAEGGPLDPNTGDANDYINAQMTTPGEPGEPSPYGKYISAKVGQFDAREAAFLEGAGEQGIENSPAVWAQFKEAHPIPAEVLHDGPTNSATYQISIRATAGRRFASLLVPGIGALSYLWGSAMPGEYYDKPEDADGYIADPLLDLLAIRSIDQSSWRNSTRLGAFAGNQIEVDLGLPWTIGADDPLSQPPEVQEALGITGANPQWIQWWITEAKKQGRYGPSVGDNKNPEWWYQIAHMGKEPLTYEMWLEEYHP